MDSKILNKQLRLLISPLLREQGFTAFTGRTAWRYWDNRIDVVSLQSFNSYLAEVIGCTTFSFAARIGCYITAIPAHFGIKAINSDKGRLRPKEYECHFRRTLQKTLYQPMLLRDDVWYLDEQGKNLDSVMENVGQAIQKQVLPWYDSFGDDAGVLAILENEYEQWQENWGFGAKSSPIRNYMSGYMALALGKREQGSLYLKQALDANCFPAVQAQMTVDIANAQAVQQCAAPDAGSRVLLCVVVCCAGLPSQVSFGVRPHRRGLKGDNMRPSQFISRLRKGSKQQRHLLSAKCLAISASCSVLVSLLGFAEKHLFFGFLWGGLALFYGCLALSQYGLSRKARNGAA